METISINGRTAIVLRVGEGLVGKMPRCMQEGLPDREEFAAEVDNAFYTEDKILRRLGRHPGIVTYYGPCKVEGMNDGLLLSEANRGDLQSYIDKHNAGIKGALRRKWSLQIAQAVAHLHEKGVVHSDLSTANVLVHQTGQTLDLFLADFGGSRCVQLNLYGGLLPDDPFSDPRLTDYASPQLDVFSLGIVIYIIMTGFYPFRNDSAPQGEEKFAYGDRVRKLFEQGYFPNLSNVSLGGIVAGCCCERRFSTAQEVFAALRAEVGK